MISPLLHGISPVYPLLIMLFIAALSFFTAWWSYQYLNQIDLRKKVALILLRGSAFFVLILLLINPYILTQSTDIAQPSIAVYIDNSQSMSVVRGEYDGFEEYSQIIDEFRSSRDNSFHFSEYLFSDQISQPGTIDLTGTRTNFNLLFEHLREREHRYTAAVLFSDGIVTQGRNPLFSAQNLTIPVITVAVGDTSDVKDVAIAGVDYISTVYTYTSQNIQIEVQQEGFEGEFFDVQIFRNGTLIETLSEEFPSAVSSQIIEFHQEYEEPGFYEYEINIPPLPEEFTIQNNRTTFTVEVLDDKTQILSIASEIHPDISSIRRVIATDKQNELTTSLALENGRFIGVNPIESDTNPDLIILHGLPDPQSELFEWLKLQNTPYLVHLLPTTFHRAANPELFDLLGFRISGISDPIQIQLDPQRSSASHPIIELSSYPSNRLPTLQTIRGEYTLSPLSEKLFMSLFERIETEIPVLIAEDTSVLRKVFITAFGWYRFEQSTDNQVQSLFQDLITNVVSWSSTSPDKRTLTIYPQKDTYTENEIISIRAELFNELGEPETEAFIDLRVYQGDSDESIHQIRMRHQQNEIYTADLGNLPQGIYRLKAEANKNDRLMGSAENRVTVSESIIEFLNTRRDDEMLRQIAEITNGENIALNDLFRINELINEYQNLRNEQISYSENFHFLYRSGYWFIIVLVILSAEWMIRRNVSLP